ncbi:hypothetical protein Tco_0824987 [Tanacetum coccineum]
MALRARVGIDCISISMRDVCFDTHFFRLETWKSTMDITEALQKLKFLCHWANRLQALSNLRYVFSDFMDYFWSHYNLWDIIVDGDLQEEAATAGEQYGPPAPKTAKDSGKELRASCV